MVSIKKSRLMEKITSERVRGIAGASFEARSIHAEELPLSAVVTKDLRKILSD